MLRADGYVGILAADIHFPENGSLKDKRRHLRSLKTTLARRYGASVSEVGFQDLWQRTRLLISITAASSSDLERALDLAFGQLEQGEGLLSAVHREIIKVEAD